MSTVPEKSEKERDRLPFEPTSKRQKTRPAAGPAARSTVKKEPKKTPISKEDVRFVQV
ncbi:MAG: hypothetical protein EBE86_005105 [Hormoscilla sp. GUM202]|nr:hypothetical protein [Hormoscilla sp. GUM202]